MKKAVGNLIKFALSLGLGILLVWVALKNLSADDWQKMKDAFGRTNYAWLLPGIAIGMLSNVFRAYRWRLLLNAIGYQPRILNVVYAVFVMYLGNLAFPRLGEVSRCALLSRYEGIPIQKSLGTMITERIVDVISMLLIGLYLLIAEYDLLAVFLKEKIWGSQSVADVQTMMKAAFLALGIGFAFLVWWILRRFRHNVFVSNLLKKVDGFLEGSKSIFQLKNIWWFLFHSVVVWLCYALMVYVCFQSLNETARVSFSAALTIVFLGGFAFIATQGGIGSYPLAVQAVLALYGIAGAIGYAFGWIVWGVQTFLVIVFGGLSLILISVTHRHNSTT
jgi:uncharacterized protein (TIRG00374 family)